MTELLRVYAAEECEPARRSRKGVGSATGYPLAWSRCPRCGGTGEDYLGQLAGRQVLRGCSTCQSAGSIKDLVRQLAGHRCVRCGHPFNVGVSGEWEARGDHEAHVEEIGGGRHAHGQRAIAMLMPEVEEVARGAAGRPPTYPDGRGLNSILWSDCDERCTHQGPIRARLRDRGELWHDIKLDTPERLFASDPNVARVQASWRILTVHHLNENKADCRWWNLAALCQRCHLEVQGKVNMAQVWPHEHSEWFKPYAAGFYASSYLDEELTREQTMERLDMLLRLERMV